MIIMKNVLLIDGENFVHAVVHDLHAQNIVRQRSQLNRIDVAIITSAIARFDTGDIRYYTTRVNLPALKHPLYKKVESMRQWNSKWVPFLANRGVTFIRAGMLKVRDGRRCDNCGKTTEVLLEKGVDVRLGVDIATVKAGTKLFVLSSDSDLIPAFQVAKLRGISIVYVTLQNQVNYALKKAASAIVVIESACIKQAFKKVNK